ncbi:MAG TPA: proton-conducting transporter membrane subunit [Coriobacteriia bacterium]|nr:proton-conducting transporter membrane subunit [Coriobacteriia bacterium]
MTPTLVLTLTLVAAGASAALLLVAEMMGRADAGRKLAALLLFAAGGVALTAGWAVAPATVWGAFATGGGRATAAGLVLVLSAASLLAGGGKRSGVVSALMALGAGGAIVSLSSIDLLTMLIGIEIAAVSAYGIVASSGDGRADEAALKYFIQGSVATGFFVLGLAVVVGLAAPDAKISSLLVTAQRLPADALMLAAVGLVGALAFKSGAAPMHSWAPDAYETAPAEGAGFMAGSLKLAMVTTLAVVVSAFGTIVASGAPLGDRLVLLMGGLALLSVIIGSTVALKTRSYARLLGYAGVAQVGYALIALAASNPSGALLFISTYAVATTAAFAAAAAVRKLSPDWDGSVEGLAGLGRKHPVLGAALTLALVSLSGIPPLVGFWGKFQAFGSAIAVSASYYATSRPGFGWWLAVLAAAGVMGSIISLGYYGAIVRAVYAETGEDAPVNEPVQGAKTAIAVSAILAFVLVIAGVLPIFGDLSQIVAGFLLNLS